MFEGCVAVFVAAGVAEQLAGPGEDAFTYGFELLQALEARTGHVVGDVLPDGVVEAFLAARTAVAGVGMVPEPEGVGEDEVVEEAAILVVDAAVDVARAHVHQLLVQGLGFALLGQCEEFFGFVVPAFHDVGHGGTFARETGTVHV